MGQGVGRIKIDVATLRRIFAANQRFRQSMGVFDIVNTEPTLDTKTVFIGRPIAALHRDNVIVPDLVGNLAAYTAVGADTRDFAKRPRYSNALFVHPCCFHQRAGRAGLNTLAARDTGAVPHWVIEVKNDFGLMPAPGHTDHIIDLHLTTGAYAQIAVDTGVQCHVHCGMARVRCRSGASRKSTCLDAQAVSPLPEAGVAVVRDFAPGLICKQQFHHHALCCFGPLTD